jgi:hypothetical protein
MGKKLIGLAFSIAALAMGASAQTVTGSGTTNTVPVFTGASTVGNSPISVSGSNVGIGTTSPSSTLTVVGSNSSTIQAQGATHITGGVISSIILNTYGANFGSNPNTTITGQDDGAGGGILNLTTNNTNRLTILNNGNVGIGTTSPAYTLDVAGQIHTTSGIVFPGSSTPQTTPWTGVLCGGDYAEDMRAAGRKGKYEPGDVLVLSSGNDSDVKKSAEPYSTLVAGIYATKPGVVGLRDAVAKSTDNIPMAMVGVVPTKVSVENGPIRKGDLLVSSSIPGYAMKGTDRSRMLGAVIGKAMGSLDSGRGVIEVLVTLQ